MYSKLYFQYVNENRTINNYIQYLCFKERKSYWDLDTKIRRKSWETRTILSVRKLWFIFQHLWRRLFIHINTIILLLCSIIKYLTQRLYKTQLFEEFSPFELFLLSKCRYRVRIRKTQTNVDPGSIFTSAVHEFVCPKLQFKQTINAGQTRYYRSQISQIIFVGL